MSDPVRSHTMPQSNAEQGHPRGLYLLFFTEMWERFSYYGMRAIFILFMTKALFLDRALSSNIYGSYTGLVYLTPLLGGYISDRYWGNRRSILVGGLLMAIGELFMFFSASMISDTAQSAPAVTLMWIALTLLIVGNGFFKPNISTMVGSLYPKGDHRTDGAFTIFYMGINLGAFLSPLICGGLGETGNIHDFRWGFLAACIGMAVSTLAFLIFKNKYLVTPDGAPVGMARAKMDGKMYATVLGIVGLIFFLLTFKSLFKTSFDLTGLFIYAAIIIMPLLIFTDKSLVKDEKERISVIFILAFFVIFFWACFEQAGASLTLFADIQVKRDVPIRIPGLVILIAGSLLTFFLAKAFGWFFEWKKGLLLTVQIIGIGALLTLFFSGHMPDYVKQEFPASWFQTINALGIVVLAPLFTIFWNFLNKRRLEPSSPLKMAFGLVLLALGYIIIAWGVHGVDSQTKISMWWLIALYILHTMGELSLSPIGLSMVSKLAPARFASLLMGTWFLSNSVANKFAGTLSALIPPGAGESSADITVKIPSFLGIEITNLFTFFCLFIALSGGAAVILFGLYRWLEKRMHGVK